MHLPAARHRHPPPQTVESEWRRLHAHRTAIFGRDFAHHVFGHGNSTLVWRQVQGSDALRGFGRAFCLRWRAISNTRPLLNWLNGLAKAPFGHQTPDGYPLTELNWASFRPNEQRFEIARLIGRATPDYSTRKTVVAATRERLPQLSNRLYFEAVEHSWRRTRGMP